MISTTCQPFFIDNRIQSQQEKINLLEKQKQAFLQQMFI